MNKSDLEKLTKEELIELLLKKEKKPKVVIVDTKPTRVNRPPPPIPEGVKPFKPKQKLRRKQKVVNDRPGWIRNQTTNRWIKIYGPTFRKLYPMLNMLNKKAKEIDATTKSIDDRYKKVITQNIPSVPFNFDDDIFQTENTSLGKFKIISVQNRENKKFKSYTNEFKVKILKKLDDDKDIYHIFQEIVKTVKKRRNLSNNDMLRIVIQNEELPKAISTKFKKVKDFELGDLENIIKILEYRAIPIENCKIVVQSVKIPTGKGRLYLTKDTISRKNCIITVKNDDSTCLARSIVRALANLHPEKWTKNQLKNGFNGSRKLQKDESMKLHKEANVEINEYGNDLADVETFAKHLEIEINIIDSEVFNTIIYTANKGTEDKIYILKTRNHFDVIKSLTAFNDTPYYCHDCNKAYTKRDKHKCPSKCLSCFTFSKDGKCEGQEIACKKCNRKFLGKKCFKNHLKNRSKAENKTDTVCNSVKKCLDCSRIITGKYVDSHKCGYCECNNCGKYVDSSHKCYMKKLRPKGGNCLNKMPCKNNSSIKKTDWCYSCRTYTEKYIFYDFECTQNTDIHTVNLSIAQDFDGNEYVHNSIDEFCKYFLNDKYKEYTFIAHNSKGYDSHFVLKWLIDQGIKPYCIYNGAKIMFMEIPKLSIRFIDSLNFLQMPLKSFPKTFGMNELKKDYFPHYFNKECNKNYVGSMPSKNNYCYNQMKPDERTKFLKWYEERVRENYVFDFKKEILEYCRSDVDILRRGVMKLREDFIQLENIDPLRYITIASVCMTIYRSNYMPNKTIAIVPEYAKKDNYSKMSIMWLNYMSKAKGLNIQHALNGGEKKLTIDDKTYKVDGFCEETNTVYEFHGCFWHGCPNCYNPNIIKTKNQNDMGTLNDLTIEKRENIKSAGYNHVSIYECQLNKNKEFQKFAKDFEQEIVEPLNPRDAFYGGRTNATKLLYNFKENECGRYVDFCSLYPTVQYYQKYPIGHPVKIHNPKKYCKSWYGLIKCKVVPPKGLYHAVLPQRIKVDSYEKLIFTLCKTCAETRNQNKCKHTDTKRSFIGTWTTDEVSKALEKGYKILRIYEVWHFAKSTDTLFKGYIRRFMKIKLESSSYNFKTKEEEVSFKVRIKDSLDIDVEKFEFNAGLRSIAKLCLNSLWGKFGQRSNMSQTKYVTEVSEFYEILLDDKLDNINFQFINDDMVQMTYNFKDQFVDNSNNTNIFIACFTTSHARLMLYDKLNYLEKAVLYFDTDSIIYVDDGTKNIKTGDMLGDMTDELSDKAISSFVSTGPKSYSFKFGDDEQKSAIKGFTLNHENSSILNHDSMRKIVKKQIRELTIINENKITRKNREIVNEYCEKVFKFGYDKRVIKQVDENYIDTLPYGY